jgi:hypothetical protein
MVSPPVVGVPTLFPNTGDRVQLLRLHALRLALPPRSVSRRSEPESTKGTSPREMSLKRN